MTDENKTPHEVAKSPQKKIDINNLSFDLRIPGSVILDILNSLKMTSEKFRSSFDFVNTRVNEWIKSHIQNMGGEPKETADKAEIQETKTEAEG